MPLSISVRSADVDTPPLVLDLPRVIIGRGASSEVRLPDPSVSQRHASIRQRGKDYIVLDEGSTNGTYIGPVKLTQGTPRLIRSGDMIRVGRIWLEVRIDHGVPPSSGQLTKELALRLVAGSLRADGAPCAPVLSVTQGPDAGQRLALEEFHRSYVVGRGPQCDLRLEDDDLSRRHFELKRVGADVVVVDLGSKNGSNLDGEAISGERRWRPGQILQAGQTRFELEDPLQETLEEIDRTPDELVDESIPPPAAESNGAELDAADPAEFGASGFERQAAPVVERPRAAPGALPARSRRSSKWSAIDGLVAFVAVVVLGLSIAGILWLMRS